MPTPAQDLKEKLRLENKLRRLLERYNLQVVNEFRSVYARTGDELNISAFNDDLAGILQDHWKETGDIFSDRIGPTLPQDVVKTEGERSLIAEALLLWYLARVPEHVRQINGTTRDQIREAIQEAEDDELVREFVGVERRRTAAAVASNNLRRKLAGRVSGIAATETQIPAETAKATEAQVLIGIPPRISGSTRQTVELIKTWWSVADSLVRDAHLSADGQERPENLPFDVGGEQLRYPGDDSLGATAKNIVNCRCGAQYDRKQIIAHRRLAA